jgi:hypothetical protein
VPGQRSGNLTYRATAGAKPRQGNSRFLLVADRKIDARSQAQDSPRRTSGHAVQIRASEHDHRRLKASSPPLHDHNLDGFQHRLWREDAQLRRPRLTRDIRAKKDRQRALWANNQTSELRRAQYVERVNRGFPAPIALGLEETQSVT